MATWAAALMAAHSVARDSRKNEFSLACLFNRLRIDTESEFFSQGRERLRPTRVCDCEVYIFPRKDACERSADLAGTNNGVLPRDSPHSQRMLKIVSRR
jgi:hypothetical protein